MSANTNSDQVRNIHGTWFLALTEWDARMQTVKRGPCRVSTYVRERDGSLPRECTVKTAFGR